MKAKAKASNKRERGVYYASSDESDTEENPTDKEKHIKEEEPTDEENSIKKEEEPKVAAKPKKQQGRAKRRRKNW